MRDGGPDMMAMVKGDERGPDLGSRAIRLRRVDSQNGERKIQEEERGGDVGSAKE